MYIVNITMCGAVESFIMNHIVIINWNFIEDEVS